MKKELLFDPEKLETRIGINRHIISQNHDNSNRLPNSNIIEERIFINPFLLSCLKSMFRKKDSYKEDLKQLDKKCEAIDLGSALMNNKKYDYCIFFYRIFKNFDY